jgi:hypothetical protein
MWNGLSSGADSAQTFARLASQGMEDGPHEELL